MDKDIDLQDFLEKWGPRIPPFLARVIERIIHRFPRLQKRVDQEFSNLLADLGASLNPYRSGEIPDFTALPRDGLPPEEVLPILEKLSAHENPRWQDGFSSGGVYHGGQDHIDLLNRAYTLHSQSNPLHADVWPATVRLEAEIISMAATMLGGDTAQQQDPQVEVGGTLTSGGTESILMAVKTYRDWARARKGIRHPEMVLPVSAHPAFDKAADYFGVRSVRTPLDEDYRADVEAVRRALNRNTILIVGSAPGFPHGIIDPIEQLSEIARSRNIGFHTDACLGGFVLPWAEKLGWPVPPFDFRLPGVTSMSADTHKYGYAAKGTSVILYRTPDLRRFQYFTATDWPGGLYVSPAVAGSRPGGLVVACWAALVSTGENGYLEATRRILETGKIIREGVEAIPELKVLGDPLWIIAFTSEEVDIYQVMDAMIRRGWSLSGLQKPPAFHMAITLRQTQPGVAQRFLDDLRDAVTEVRDSPPAEGGMAPIYGLAGSLPFRGLVDDLLRRYVDMLYKLD